MKENITKYIENNKEITGGTFDLDGNLITFDSGYSVGITKIIDGKDAKDIYNLDEIIKILEEKDAHIFGIKNIYVGFWKENKENKENNATYWDITINIPNKHEAKILAEMGNEIAIWDCANSEEIVIKK